MKLWKFCKREYFPNRPRIRSDKTIVQYELALKDLRKLLGRAPTEKDLTDDTLHRLQNHLIERGLAAQTANTRISRIKALWNYMAKRGIVRCFPTLDNLRVPCRAPQAWTQEQLQTLFAACASETKTVGTVPGNIWWTAYHTLSWNTAERIGAVLCLQWSHVDLQARSVVVPAEIRKAQTPDMHYQLWPQTIPTLEAIRPYSETYVFPFPYSRSSFYARYTALLKRAGLPHDRKHKAHCLRVSHATWTLAISGQHATTLGHASSQTTEKHYEDPRICHKQDVKLPIPWDGSC